MKRAYGSPFTVGSWRILGIAALAAGSVAAAGCNSQPAAAPAAALAPAPMPAAQVHTVDAFLQTLPAASVPPLNQTEAMTLASYPLSCLDHLQSQPGAFFGATPAAPAPGRGSAAPAARPQAYLWQPTGATQLLPGYDRQRSFYGCYDWHSAVNSTWTLVTVLKTYPNIPIAELIREKLNAHLGKSNLAGERAFFQHAHAFEQPYGQAWLLKLYNDLLGWNDPDAQKWAANMAPLAGFFTKNLTTYLTKLPTPIRQGVHPNTAFDMNNMLPYAAAHAPALHRAIVATTMRFYAHDHDCPTAYEPEGVSFLSPCLVEAALMSHVLDRAAFLDWFNNFMPPVYSAKFHALVSPFDASKMTKDQMAGQSHLIGLAFSRAAAMLTIANALPANDPRVPVFRRLAAIHATKGFQTLDKAGYLETHWIASYALMYEVARKPAPAAAPAAAAATDPQ